MQKEEGAHHIMSLLLSFQLKYYNQSNVAYHKQHQECHKEAMTLERQKEKSHLVMGAAIAEQQMIGHIPESWENAATHITLHMSMNVKLV